MALVFERLDRARHDREGFSCGDAALDAYLKMRAGQDARRNLAACYVLCEQGDGAIVGYYTLSALGIEPTGLAPALVARLPRYPLLPAILLGRLAVATRYRGQHMGERLLLDAIHRASASDIAAFALVVDALDGEAAAFYEHYGFTPFANAPLRLYLLLGEVRDRFQLQVARPC